MIADFLQLVVNKTFKYSDYQNNKTAKIMSVKKTLKLNTARLAIEPVFLKTNYDYFVINNDTNLDTVNYTNIYKLNISVVNNSKYIDLSKFKHLYKIITTSRGYIAHQIIFGNNCNHFRNIRFVNIDSVPIDYQKDFYKSIKNAYSLEFSRSNINSYYISTLTNIHTVHLSSLSSSVSSLKNSYILFVRQQDILFHSLFCIDIKYSCYETDNAYYIIVKKSQHDFTIKQLCY